MALQPGQSVMVNLPQTGTVAMTLTKPCGPLTWKAADNSGANHRISAQWIFLLSNRVTCPKTPPRPKSALHFLCCSLLEDESKIHHPAAVKVFGNASPEMPTCFN